ncbi:MAG: PEP-CTERM sorting domain-containing protein [Gemmataceae bacterium]
MSAPPAGFDTSVPYSWRIIDPKAGNSATLQVKANDIVGDTTILSLSSATPEDLAIYNARLNQIFKFESEKWIDPNTNAAIDVDPASMMQVGTFSYSFSNYDTNMNQYRSIDLVYTPVPEPTLMLTAGAAVLAIMIKRRKRSVPAPVPV